MPRWTVYSRPGCSLCEAFVADLAEFLSPAQAASVEIIDITDDPELEARYSAKIPVLTADGDFLCCYHLDRARVQAYLGD